MMWLLTATAVWFVLALSLGILIGKGIELANRRESRVIVTPRQAEVADHVQHQMRWHR